MDWLTYRQILNQMKTESSETSENEEDYILTLWDHGGQIEFYATHHIFLDPKATNLIVMDISKRPADPLDRNVETAVPSTPAKFLCYWLNTIHTMIMSSDDKNNTGQPNIVLVLTHKDKIKADDKDKYIEEYKDAILSYIDGKAYSKYFAMDDIYVVDNTDDSDDDFDVIRKRIFQMIAKQEGWGRERPLRWLKLEADVRREARRRSIRYIEFDSVLAFGLKYGMEEPEVEAFLRLHSEWGDFVYYPDEALRDLVITDPQWLVDMFKTLITPHEFIDKRQLTEEIKDELKNAIVSDRSLEVLWKKKDKEFLLELLSKFELLIPLSTIPVRGRRFLIPCMVTSEKRLLDKDHPAVNTSLATFDAAHQPRVGDTLLFGTFPRLVSKLAKTRDWLLC